jgi:hypothetical protein
LTAREVALRLFLSPGLPPGYPMKTLTAPFGLLSPPPPTCRERSPNVPLLPDAEGSVVAAGFAGNEVDRLGHGAGDEAFEAGFAHEAGGCLQGEE